MTGTSFHTSSGVVYDSEAMYDLAYFIERLFDGEKVSIFEHVRTLKFNLPHDGMSESGVLEYLNKHRHPGDLGVAADMCRSLIEAYNIPALVPDKKWFQVIVRLLRYCRNVETIEVPSEWGNVQWYDNNFLAIDLTDPLQAKRQAAGGRWRWGKDPVVVPVPVSAPNLANLSITDTGEEERSLQLD
ncbi:hypothetical protein CC86DRAFT_339937 [Ophiobolus disseminans]|uniref:Uncharacterized protein n=1 Tax=Ophiobolus disseminans TaxID=1469910 RepID=A0A6A7AF08_9PLEO|nr:hypothetical protein CC86DRAFT_339937 [Ophiobolus disseminans]